MHAHTHAHIYTDVQTHPNSPRLLVTWIYTSYVLMYMFSDTMIANIQAHTDIYTRSLPSHIDLPVPRSPASYWSVTSCYSHNLGPETTIIVTVRMMMTIMMMVMMMIIMIFTANQTSNQLYSNQTSDQLYSPIPASTQAAPDSAPRCWVGRPGRRWSRTPGYRSRPWCSHSDLWPCAHTCPTASPTVEYFRLLIHWPRHTGGTGNRNRIMYTFCF
jgi:hypothetical protein